MPRSKPPSRPTMLCSKTCPMPYGHEGACDPNATLYGFKIGDKVRIYNPANPTQHGHEGTVSGFTGFGGSVLVYPDYPGHNWKTRGTRDPDRRPLTYDHNWKMRPGRLTKISPLMLLARAAEG